MTVSNRDLKNVCINFHENFYREKIKTNRPEFNKEKKTKKMSMLKFLMKFY
jgi:hypothetical protein